MSYGVLQEMPGVTEADYKAVERHLGPDRPQGLLAHVSGPADGGWRVINIWESEAAYQRFRSERLLRAAGLAAADEGFDPTKAARFTSVSVSGSELPF